MKLLSCFIAKMKPFSMMQWRWTSLNITWNCNETCALVIQPWFKQLQQLSVSMKLKSIRNFLAYDIRAKCNYSVWIKAKIKSVQLKGSIFQFACGSVHHHVITVVLWSSMMWALRFHWRVKWKSKWHARTTDDVCVRFHNVHNCPVSVYLRSKLGRGDYYAHDMFTWSCNEQGIPRS